MAIKKTQVVAWLRQEANRHIEIAKKYREAARVAESAENESHSANGAPVEDTGEQEEEEEQGLPSVEDVAEFLTAGAKRIPEIARRFDVDEEALQEILTEENGFIRGERGWWTYTGDEVEEDEEEEEDDEDG